MVIRENIYEKDQETLKLLLCVILVTKRMISSKRFLVKLNGSFCSCFHLFITISARIHERGRVVMSKNARESL